MIDLTGITAAEGFIIQGDSTDDRAGWSVSSAGDVNGDGFDDLIVGAPYGDDGGIKAGEAYVLYGGVFGGTVVTTGSAAAEILVGGTGDDTLSGGGGVDSLRGGAGDDTLTVADLAFRSIDGGNGNDTLVFAGTAETIDFTTIADNKVTGIEVFDVSGTGNDTLVIGALDIFHFSDTPNGDFTGADSLKSLVVYGDAGDSPQLDDFDPDGGGPVDGYTWQLTAPDKHLDGSADGNFDFYNLVRSSAVLASVAVDTDMLVV